jgi:DNA polymerase III epsilon subunit-like protein
MKCLLIDTETTGLTPGSHCIVQLAVRITANQGEVKQFSLSFRPRRGALVAPEALAVQGLSLDDLHSADRLGYTEGFFRFKSLLSEFVNPRDTRDKFHVFAYNQDFDQRFLRQFWADHGDPHFGSWFWTPWFDVWGMAGLHLMERRAELESTKLAAVARVLGVDVPGVRLHDARGDVALTAQVLHAVDPRFDFRLPEERTGASA